MLSKARSTWPPASAFMMSPDERNGTWVTLAPVSLVSTSDVMWFDEPCPEDPKLSLPSLAFT